MGLTASSTGNNLLDSNFEELKKHSNYTIALARKSKCTASLLFLMV